MNSLLSNMLSHADPSQVEGLARFFKTGPGQYGYGDKFLGIKVPVTREVVKECWRQLGFEELEECITSEYHEVRLAALLALVEVFKRPGRSFVAGAPQDDREVRPERSFVAYAPQDDRRCHSESTLCHSESTLCHSERPSCHSERSEESLRQQCVSFYLSHTAYINNWDLVDLSCYPLLGEWLLDSPDRSLLYDLARNGRTIWEQRIGIVSTMTFIRHGQLEDTFAIADILLHHPHDLIHKAVGWLLREAGKRDKAALEAYLDGCRSFVADAPQDDRGGRPNREGRPERSFVADAPQDDRGCHSEHPSCHSERSEESLPRYRTMPRTMLRYAIEKFPETERQQYLAK